MTVVTCDRAADALTCSAIQWTGSNFADLYAFTGGAVVENFGRLVLVNPSGSVMRWLDVGDWIVRGRGEGWDFYPVPNGKFRLIWTPREGA